MTARHRRRLRYLIAASALTAAGMFGFAAGRSSSPALDADDLTPAGVNNCLTAVKGSLALLDPDSIVAFSPAEIAELRVLPERCEDPDVAEALAEEYPALVDRLRTIGR